MGMRNEVSTNIYGDIKLEGVSSTLTFTNYEYKEENHVMFVMWGEESVICLTGDPKAFLQYVQMIEARLQSLIKADEVDSTKP